MTVETVRSPSEMRVRAAAWRAEGRRIVLVPTMGYLHAGHISLLDEGRRRGDVLVLSIFVNPAQFGPGEDLSRYPRDLDRDLAVAQRARVDVVFVPEPAAMYPPGYQTFVEVRELQKGLCGERRAGHFVGVATVVLKLCHLVQPHVTLFGTKDYQQLQVIRRMVSDLDLELEIIGMPIVRETDGLALSSRNAYLSGDERRRALLLSQALSAVHARFVAGERHTFVLVEQARTVLESGSGVRVDYVELRDAETLVPAEGTLVSPAVLAVAAYIGATRLIDNLVLSP